MNLDNPAALAELNLIEACLERVVEINPGYFYGAPCILLGSMLAAKPGMMGGDPARAKEFFDRAMEANQGKFYLTHYHYARYYSVRVQDRELFQRLGREVALGRPDELKAVCLINAVMQQKMKHLMETSEEHFF